MHWPSKRMWRKAARMLLRGRVAVHAVGPYGLLATVEGDTDSYEVSYEGGEWQCGCIFGDYHPGRMCSHEAACFLVWNAMRKGSEGNERRTRYERDP